MLYAKLLDVIIIIVAIIIQAVPVSSCGLKRDNEASRVAVGIRLALNIFMNLCLTSAIVVHESTYFTATIFV